MKTETCQNCGMIYGASLDDSAFGEYDEVGLCQTCMEADMTEGAYHADNKQFS